MTTIFDDWGTLADEELLENHGYLLGRVAHFQAMAGRSEQEMLRRMNERKAAAIPSEMYICEVETRDTYSQPGFTPLKEVFYPEDLESCLIWAHEETVQMPDKWDTVKVKTLARRYGKEALDIVEKARIPGAPRLKFRRRESAQAD